MGQNNSTKISDIFTNILLGTVLILLLAIPGYLCYELLILSKPLEETSSTVNTDKNNPPQKSDVVTEEISEENVLPEEGEHYTEYFPIIEDQQAYVIAPKVINKARPSTLVVYSHGAEDTVTQNLEDPFMIGLKEYGILFTQYNYIFAASNQHGINLGNEASLRDTKNLIEWVSKNYSIQNKIHMIGFSMGGLPTMNYASQNPNTVSKIALLAASARLHEWNQTRADKIKGIDIKIWHGNKDTYVPYSNSIEFVDGMKEYGIDIELEILDNKTHYEIDTEYMNEILIFFSS